MDYTQWFEMQQNPNPNFSLIHTPNHPHNFVCDPYQPPAFDPHNALFLSQPRPPGVDPPYVPPPPPYVPPPATVNYAQQPIVFEPQQSAAAVASVAAYYTDPNLNWAAAISQIAAASYGAGVSTPNPTDQLQTRHTWKKAPKKTKVVQSAWCEVCKIDCNSKGVLDQHKIGKKHLKNLEKLKAQTAPSPIITASIPATALNPPAIVATPHAELVASPYLPAPALTLAPADKPVIGPQENPEKSTSSNAQKSRKKAAARTEDLDTKRRRVLEGGAAPNSVRACSICKVVCNSDTVFNYHLAGQKHASMIKKHAVKAGLALAM